MLRTCLAIMLMALLPFAATADQTNPRLDDLFTRLRITEDVQQLQFLEASIWEIWMQHNDENVERLLAIGTQRMNAGQFPEALLIFTELVAAEPEFAEAWNKRATLYYLMGNLDASLADIERTLTLEPRHFGALSGRGLIHIQREELGQAEDAFEELLDVHPNSRNGQENLERVRQELRRSVI